MSFKVYMLGQFKQQANDGGQINAIRIGDWKAIFLEQRAKGMMAWNEPFVEPALAQAIQTAAGSPLRVDESSITYWGS